MKIKSIAIAAALAFGAAGAFAGGGPITFLDGTAGFSATDAASPGLITDVFTFSLVKSLLRFRDVLIITRTFFQII